MLEAGGGHVVYPEVVLAVDEIMFRVLVDRQRSGELLSIRNSHWEAEGKAR